MLVIVFENCHRNYYRFTDNVAGLYRGCCTPAVRPCPGLRSSWGVAWTVWCGRHTCGQVSACRVPQEISRPVDLHSQGAASFTWAGHCGEGLLSEQRGLKPSIWRKALWRLIASSMMSCRSMVGYKPYPSPTLRESIPRLLNEKTTVMTTCCAPACSQALPVKPQGVWDRGIEAWALSRDRRNWSCGGCGLRGHPA